MRAVNEEWLLDHAPDEALRVVAARVGQLRERTVDSPVPGVLVITRRYVTSPTAIVSLLLVPFTAGLSVIVFLFAKSAFRCTVRVEPDGSGTRLAVMGRANERMLGAMRRGLGVEETS